MCFFFVFRDSISHAIHHEESLKDDTVYSILHNITSLLRTQFPFSNIYPVLGNMDWYPKNKMSTQVSAGEFKRRLQLYGKLWDTWVPPESLDTFNQGNIMTMMDSLLLAVAMEIENVTTWTWQMRLTLFFTFFLFPLFRWILCHRTEKPEATTSHSKYQFIHEKVLAFGDRWEWSCWPIWMANENVGEGKGNGRNGFHNWAHSTWENGTVHE